MPDRPAHVKSPRTKPPAAKEAAERGLERPTCWSYGVHDRPAMSMPGCGREQMAKRRLVAGLLVALALGTGAAAAEKKAAVDTRTVGELVKALGDEIPARRMTAAKALAKKGKEDKAVAGALIAALRHKDWRVRRGATDALAAIGPEAKGAVGALVAALKDKDMWVRDGAAVALGKIGPAAGSAAKPLVEAMRDGDVWVRESAIASLRSITKDEEVLLAGALIVVKTPSTGFSAKRHAMGFVAKYGKGRKDAIAAMIRMLENPGEGMWRGCLWQAIDMLGEAGPAAGAAVPVLIEGLKASRKEHRMKSVAALGKIASSTKATAAALEAVAKGDKEEQVRTAAAEALRQIQQRKPAPKPKRK